MRAKGKKRIWEVLREGGILKFFSILNVIKIWNGTNLAYK